MSNIYDKRNIAMFLTCPEMKKATKEILNRPVEKTSKKKLEKKYGLPKGFKLIGFDIEV